MPLLCRLPLEGLICMVGVNDCDCFITPTRGNVQSVLRSIISRKRDKTAVVSRDTRYWTLLARYD